MKSKRSDSGVRLKRAREDKGLTQTEAATALEIDPMTLSRYERGTRAPTGTLVSAMARLYGVDAGLLLDRGQSGGEAPPAPTATPAGALYWAMAKMQEAMGRISREAARLASEPATRAPGAPGLTSMEAYGPVPGRADSTEKAG